MKNKPDLAIESTINGQVVGIDEAGRGPLAGPVFAASVILNKKKIPSGIDDSKSLSPEKRQALYKKITESSIYGLSMSSVIEIDRLNILQATLLAMRRSYINLSWKLSTLPSHALIDGNQSPRLPCKTITIIKGDKKSKSIAAASIIAKVHRDRLMKKLSLKFQDFGWEKNAGYGTKMHIENIYRLGPTIHHRKTFEPIKSLIHS